MTDLGIRQKDGTFKPPYGRKIYSLTHLAMNIRKSTETDVTAFLVLLEVLFVAAGLALTAFGLI